MISGARGLHNLYIVPGFQLFEHESTDNSLVKYIPSDQHNFIITHISPGCLDSILLQFTHYINLIRSALNFTEKIRASNLKFYRYISEFVGIIHEEYTYVHSNFSKVYDSIRENKFPANLLKLYRFTVKNCENLKRIMSLCENTFNDATSKWTHQKRYTQVLELLYVMEFRKTIDFQKYKSLYGIDCQMGGSETPYWLRMFALSHKAVVDSINGVQNPKIKPAILYVKFKGYFWSTLDEIMSESDSNKTFNLTRGPELLDQDDLGEDDSKVFSSNLQKLSADLKTVAEYSKLAKFLGHKIKVDVRSDFSSVASAKVSAENLKKNISASLLACTKDQVLKSLTILHNFYLGQNGLIYDHLLDECFMYGNFSQTHVDSG